VVWAKAPLAGIANAGSSAANNGTAKRCKVILAYLLSPNRKVRDIAASYDMRLTISVTKPRGHRWR
jgi:hypothetical protein